MIPSLLTALCFAMAGISARQSTQYSGAERANTGRLLVGIIILGILALLSWQGMPFRSMIGLAIAGGIGFGFGGFCMLQSLRRLGTPTSLLMVESITAVLAGALAWVTVKDTMNPQQILACGIIISSVLFAGWKWMRESQPEAIRDRYAGYSFAFLASTFQAISLVISRQVFVSAAQNGLPIEKLDAAFVRMVGGAAIACVFLVSLSFRQGELPDFLKNEKVKFQWIRSGAPTIQQPLFWITVNGLFGPVFGVTCWLWAVSLINPGIVQSIAAVAPLISLPVARLLEKEKLGMQFYIGAPVAIVGIALLALS